MPKETKNIISIALSFKNFKSDRINNNNERKKANTSEKG